MPSWCVMPLNPAAKRLVRRYSKLNTAGKERFLERTAFNYNDARCIRSLVDWAAENNLPHFLEKFLHDATNCNNTDLVNYVLERVYCNKDTLGKQGAHLFHTWVKLSNFDCERACLNATEVWDLKWIHNLIPYVQNDDVRFLAYNAVINFLAPVTVESGFKNPENIINRYYDNLIACLVSEEKCEHMMSRLRNHCKPSTFLETVSCGVQKQRLQLHVGEASCIVASRKI